MEQNYIIEKILEIAKRDADKLVKEANKSSVERISKAQKEADEDVVKAVERAKRKSVEEASQAEIVAKTATMRERITNKQSTIDQVFATVRKQLLTLNAKEAQAFVAALIKKEATAGDTVVISKNDSAKITADFIKGLPVKNLKLKPGGDFDGGIVLQNEKYDLSLTLDELLADLRTEIELEVSKMLF